MASRWVRSLFWLVACGGISYGLLVLSSPSEADAQKLREQLTTQKERKENLSKNQQFMNVLVAASDSKKPIYRLPKEEIDKEIKRE